jgi:uncharacterized protein (DUF2252 family)
VRYSDVATSPSELLGPIPPTSAQRRSAGRQARRRVARSAHAGWLPPPDRADPVEVLAESNRTRVPELVPLRYRRMIASPFAFLRGSALVMALDLAARPSSGIEVTLCGDAHVANFGLFASPERRLLFDLNDFDEAGPGPFEWDLARLVASAAVGAGEAGLRRAGARRAALAAAGSYREWIGRYAGMSHLDVWYARLEVDQLLPLARGAGRAAARRVVRRAGERTHHRAVAKLTELREGRRRIVPDPPLITSLDDDPDALAQLPEMVASYRTTLTPAVRDLLDHYHLVDAARKVVGVGSVGTRCWVLVLQGPDGSPLVLQAKEAGVAAPQAAGWPAPPMHAGERVVQGQRRLQAASDLLLGWTTAPATGTEYYVRQLWDAKGSAELTELPESALLAYVRLCGWALARAHARRGAAAEIAGYLGRSDRFDRAMADFALAYASQTAADHAALVAAVDSGRLPVSAHP